MLDLLLVGIHLQYRVPRSIMVHHSYVYFTRVLEKVNGLLKKF